jgi:hypothetical protein
LLEKEGCSRGVAARGNAIGEVRKVAAGAAVAAMAAAFDPQSLAVKAPGLSFNAWGAADLRHSDFTRAIASTVFGVLVVGFALKGLWREADGREHKHGKRQGTVPKRGANFHGLLVEENRQTARLALSEPGIGGGEEKPHPRREKRTKAIAHSGTHLIKRTRPTS